MASNFAGSIPSWVQDLPQTLPQALAQVSLYRELAWSCAILVCASLVGRLHSRRLLKRAESSVEERRHRHANFRNGLILATLALLGFVWGGEIRSLILSLAAITAAAMIVSKEIISCFYGSLIFSFSKLARIGDSIEVGPHKGELMDYNWLSLTLMEVSETHYYSGKIVKIPTSSLLSFPLVNLSQGGAYRFAALLFHARHEHGCAALRIARDAASEVCAPWIHEAKNSFGDLMSSHLSNAPDVESMAALVSVDKDSLAVSLRFVAPAGSRAQAQAEISRLYFEAFEAYLREERIAERAAEREFIRSERAGDPGAHSSSAVFGPGVPA